MHTYHWYTFVLAYENVGIVVIQFAGEEVSISIGRGECIILVLGLWMTCGRV
jgi:hypothetical protein